MSLNLTEVIAKARVSGRAPPACSRTAIPAARMRVRMAKLIGWPALEESWRRDLEFLESLEVDHAAVRKRAASDVGQGEPD